jgi:outer membrane cobalamin receptor
VGGATCARLETKSIGVELDGKLFLGDFVFDLNATVQEPEIDNGEFAGNQVLRQPTHQMRLTPSYNFAFNNGVEASVYGTVSLISDRYGDNANTNKLDSYTKLDLGVQVNVDNLNFQLAVDNATDELALTESDPRAVGASANGRYILPRNIKFSMGYSF